MYSKEIKISKIVTDDEYSITSDVFGMYSKYVLKPMEEEVKQGLIDLGWMPPIKSFAPTFKAGDWVTNKRATSIYVFLKVYQNKVDVMDRNGIIHKDCPLSNFTPHTLTEADLPDCPFCEEALIYRHHDSDANHHIYCDRNRCYTIQGFSTKHDAISEALKVHIGQRLLKERMECVFFASGRNMSQAENV